MIETSLIPCPAPECDKGKVLVYNAYAADPLKPETEHCALCNGRGSIHSGATVAVAN